MPLYYSRILFLAALITGCVFIFVVNPETSLYPPCLFKKLTNLQCPGCGSARACYHLLHGDFLIAVDYNLLFIAFLPLLVMEMFSRLFYVSRQTASKLRIIQNHLRPVHVLVVVLTFWIVRNLPMYPFNLLSSDHWYNRLRLTVSASPWAMRQTETVRRIAQGGHGNLYNLASSREPLSFRS